jgi:adenosylmethionine-8-amino-7-oxononanoate aminotransferase
VYPKVTHGRGIYLYGEDGKEYIDGCCGSAVANIGHGNREVAARMAEQAETLAYAHLSRFTTEPIERCAARVARLTPGDLDHCYFVSGGSEAMESALKMARQFFVESDSTSRKWRAVSRRPSFHGNTLGALSVTGADGRRDVYDPMLADFPKIGQAYCYRCPFGSTYPACGLACAEELDKTVSGAGSEQFMAFVAEPVVGSAAPGVHAPPDYFEAIQEICERHDMLLIADEVMSGFGRTGKNFGIDHYGVVPDIMAMAKGMSCGYSPLGAVVAGDKIFHTIMTEGTGHFIHGHTYGGHPLSAAVGDCVMEICEREGYYANAATQGAHLLEQMRALYDCPIVGDVRGKGLMIGVEFVADQATKEPFDPARKVRDLITLNCLDQGLVVYPGGGSVDGVRGDHFLLAPPLCITRDEVDELYRRLDAALAKTAEKL